MSESSCTYSSFGDVTTVFLYSHISVYATHSLDSWQEIGSHSLSLQRMATVAEFTNRPSQFPTVKLFAEYPLVDVEIEQLKQTNTSIALYFWLNTQPTPPAASGLLNYDIFNSVERLDALSNEHLYSARLNNDHGSV